MMESLELQPNRKLQAVRLSISIGLATLFLVVVLWGPRGLTTAYADPDILYVDGATGQDIGTCGTTSTPCKTISYILDNRASGGDTIRVAQGVYIENLGINISVTLEGGYEHTNWTRNVTLYETIIDGYGATFMRPVIDFFSGSAGSTLDGFTVQNGDAYYYGGGISIADGANAVTVRNCTIISNTAREGGGGIAVIGNANSRITGCTIANNIADMGGGLDIAGAISVTIADSLIVSNTAVAGVVGLGQGGGVVVYDSEGTIAGNEIVSNTAIGSDASGGGGLFLWGERTKSTLQDNLILGNKAYENGGIEIGGGARVDVLHNTIVSNTVEGVHGGLGFTLNGGGWIDRNIIAYNRTGTGVGGVGAGTWNTSQPVTFMNNVVFHNGGHGICIDKTGGATLANNTIAFNANAGILIYESAAHIGNNVVVSNANCGINILPDEVSTVTLEHNDFWGNGTDDYCAEGPGENDISADPKFVNPDANDFHLLSDSPCVDAGTNVGAPSTDFDNDLRPLDGNLDGVAITDIGADEFRPYRIYLPLALKNYGS